MDSENTNKMEVKNESTQEEKKADDVLKENKNEKSKLSESILRTTMDGSTTAEELKKAVRALSLNAQDMKTQIYANICKEYTQFFSTVGTISDQNERLRELLQDMSIISQRLEHELKPGINKVTSSYKELKREYVLTQNIAETLQRLFEVHGNLEHVPKAIEIQDFSTAAACINEISERLTSLSSGTCETKVFKAVREEYRTQKTMLLCRLEEYWDKVINWKVPISVSWTKLESHLNSSLTVEDQTSSLKADLRNTLYAMDLLDILDGRLKIFAKKMLTYLIKPVVIFPGLNPVVEGEVLQFQRITGKTKQIQKTENVFVKVMTILKYVNESLSNPVIGNPEDAKPLNPLMRIGMCIWSDFSDLLITECLAKAVPVSGSQLESYNQTIEATTKFEQALKEMGFIEEDTHDLVVYVKDINIHFANRKCRDLLFEARNLMTSDIHYMTKFDRSKDRAVIPVQMTPEVNEKMPQDLKRLLLGLTEIPKELLGTKTFSFPDCHISESTKKIMDIVYKSLMEATESHQAVAVQIFYSIRNIFELYIHVVPTYHKENLKLPQIAALHYNNSMYLAHHCVTLGHQFKKFLPDTLRKTGATFADLVPELRRVGRQFLFDQQKIQRRNLLDILNTCEGFTDCHAGSKSDIIECALKQIIHQLVHISKLWKDVLPDNIYFKCLGLLFGSVLEEIISRVMQIENFTADEASLLHSHLNILIEKGVNIFHPKLSVDDAVDMGFIVHIYNWEKYKELVGMLEASLMEIVDRWADGKGPLADCFDANDVRNMIRALFQNTNRRATALSQIKHCKDSSKVAHEEM